MAKEIKYGMVGGSIYAFIGEVHRKALAFDTRAELVAGCFSNVESENVDTAKAYGVAPERTYKDYKEMAAAEAKRADKIDFVSICTPNFLHYEVAKAFLLADINVVCEKPLCFAVEEAEELEKLAAERNLLFAVTYAYTGYVMPKVMKEMIANGKIGKIATVIAEYAQDWLLDELSPEKQGQAKNLHRSEVLRHLQLRRRHRHACGKHGALPYRTQDQTPYGCDGQLRPRARPQRQHHRGVRKRRERAVLVLADSGGQNERACGEDLRQRRIAGVGTALPRLCEVYSERTGYADTLQTQFLHSRGGARGGENTVRTPRGILRRVCQHLPQYSERDR